MGSKISKFADDTKIGLLVNGEVGCLGLQEDIDGMVKWADKWQMELNPEKCEVIHFRKNNLTGKFSMNGRMLRHSVEQRDLGVFVHRSLKAEGHVSSVVKKLYGTLYQLGYRLQKQGGHVGIV